MVKKRSDGASEIKAYGIVFAALKGLDARAQRRVLKYVAEMLGLGSEEFSEIRDESSEQSSTVLRSLSPATEPHTSDQAEGINPIALKWMRRSGLNPKGLQKLFSLGIDEIDLVAKSVPGNSKRERMRSVLLLKAIAAYLGTGVPRVSYEQLKEGCLHYNAYDATNFASYMKSFTADVSGSKKIGFTLNPRGLTSATELLQRMLESA